MHQVEKEKWKKTVIYIAICGMFWLLLLLMIIIRLQDEILPYSTYKENIDEEQFIRNLTSGMTIEQTFSSPHDFTCLTLSCSDHEKDLEGNMIIEVRDEGGELLAHKEIENSAVSYGVPVEIHFSQPCHKDQTYKVAIRAYDTGEEAIGFFGYIPNAEAETAILNGTVSKYALSIGTHTHTKLFYVLCIAIFVIMAIGMGIQIIILIWKNPQPQQMFLTLAIPIGITLLCFMNTNIIHDGDAHLPRAYHYSNILLGIDDRDMHSAITMRSDDVDLFYRSDCMNATNAQGMWHIYENWSWFVKDSSLVSEVECRTAGTTSILAYLPATLGITLARILGLGTYPMLYLAKIFSFLFYLVGVYYAIKIIPAGKQIMVFTASLPMAIQQATGITYDTVTLVILFLFVAFTIRIYFQDIEKKEWLFFAGCCALLGICKGGIYTPVLILLLILPKERFGDNIKKKILAILGIGILTVVLTITNYGGTIRAYLNLNTEKTTEETGVLTEQAEGEELTESVKPACYGMDIVIKKPLRFIKLLVNTIVERIDFYVKGILGSRVAWAVEEFPVWSYIIFGLILVLSKNGVGEEKYPMDITLRMGLIVATVLVFLVYHVLFLIETPLNYSWIWGIQGRYFIPQTVMLLLAMKNNGVVQKSKSDNMLYLAYNMGLILFLYGYFELFMIQTYN